MNKAKNYLLLFILFLLVDILVFKDFFLNGLHPYPGNFLLAWFEPFKSEYFINGVITLAHKPVASDIFRHIYPFKILAADMFKTGEFPLWNPYNGAGMPLLATLNTGLLNPFNFLYLLLRPSLAWTLLINLDYILIGLFTYLYARKLNLSKSSAVISSFTFLFSGFTTTRIIYQVFGPTLWLIPAVLYLIEDYLENNQTKKIFLLPFAIFLLVVSGQPQIALYVLFFWVIYFVFRIFQKKEKILSRNILVAGLLFSLGLGISSIQIFPTFELYKFANITKETSQFIFNFLLPPAHILNLLIPNYFGSEASYNYWGSADYIESIIYIGTIPLILAIFGIIFRPAKKSLNLSIFFPLSSLISTLESDDPFNL